MRRPFRFSFALLLLSACGAPDGKVLEQPEAPLPTDLAAIEKQLLEAPDNPALYAQRARYFEGLDSVAAAERDWRRAIALGGNDPQWRIGLGDLYFRRTRLVDAESLFKEATEAAPKSTEGWTKLSELYLMQSRFKEAMAMANEALRIDPQQARIYDLKGWIHRTAGDTELAISSYQTALERDPKHYDACISLGLLHAGRHDALALQYYDAALSIRPSSVEALYDKAMFAQEHDRDSLALDCYRRIMVIDPNYPLAYYNTGYILLEHQNRLPEARREFNRAIDRLPDYAPAYYSRGVTYELENKLDSALADYRLALGLAPGYTDAAHGLQRLQDKGVKVSPR